MYKSGALASSDMNMETLIIIPYLRLYWNYENN